MRYITVILLSLALITGCSKDEVEDDLEATELAYYTSAQDSLRAGNYAGAIQKLQLLESRFPFGRYAEQAQLEIIFAYYKSAQPEAARSAADRFIRLHPTHPNVDYAYYLKGMVSYEQDKNFLSSFIPMDPSTRDPGAARESFQDFSQLINRISKQRVCARRPKKNEIPAQPACYSRNTCSPLLHQARRLCRRGEPGPLRI